IYAKINPELPLKEIMKIYYCAALTWSLEHPLEFGFMEQFNASPYVRKIATSEQEVFSRPVFELLERGIHEKILKPIDIQLIHLLIVAHTMSIHKYLTDRELSHAEQQQIMHDTFDLLWNMIT